MLNEKVSECTNWRKMLKSNGEQQDLKAIRDELRGKCESEIMAIKHEQGEGAIQVIDEQVVDIKYPIEEYPEKIKSLNFDKQPDIEWTLMGIKGQYLILDVGVLNIRKFSGYNLQVDFM